LNATIEGDVAELVELAGRMSPETTMTGTGSVVAHVIATGALRSPAFHHAVAVDVPSFRYGDADPIPHIALGSALAFSGLDPDSLQGSVVLDRASMTAARIPIAQQEATFITLVDNLVRIETFRWGAEESTLTLTGEVALGGEAPVLDLDLDGEIDARVISAFVEDVGAAGIIRTRIAAAGTTEAPDIDGEIVLDALDFSVREPRLAVTDLSGTITLASDRLSGTGIEGAANGGTISIEVAASHPDRNPAARQV